MNSNDGIEIYDSNLLDKLISGKVNFYDDIHPDFLSIRDLSENLSIGENGDKLSSYEIIPRLDNRIVFIPSYRPFQLITPERITNDYAYDHSITYALVIIFNEQ